MQESNSPIFIIPAPTVGSTPGRLCLLGKDETCYAILKLLHGCIFLVAAGALLGGYNDETLNSIEGIAKKQNIKLILREPNYGSGMFTKLLIGAVQ